VCSRLALFAESEKDNLDEWATRLELLLGADSSVAAARCQDLVSKLLVEPWLERFLVGPAEARSSRMFTRLAMVASARVEPDQAYALASALLVFFPKTAGEAFRLVGGNYLTLLEALCTSHAAVRELLLGQDVYVNPLVSQGVFLYGKRMFA
jgi:hypothetical protein